MNERIEINLLPAEYRIHRTRIIIKREIFFPLIIVVLTGCVLWIWTFFMDARIKSLTMEIANLESRIQQNRPIQNQINQLKKDKQIVLDKIRALELINVNREKWVRLMEILCKNLPPSMWLTLIEEKRKDGRQVLEISGETFSFPEVANYMSELKETVYISEVDLARIEQTTTKEKTFNFNISCRVNPDVRMKQ
jgi:Tfp pilus assembly protein PilN